MTPKQITDLCVISAAIPFDPSNLSLGLAKLLGEFSNTDRGTHLAKISETFLPVSMKEEIRLFAKTSGATSVKMCSVASRRRQRA